MNVFLSTRRLTPLKEDHLTEFLAAALLSDEVFRRAYAATVLGEFAGRVGWEAPSIKNVETQKAYPHCCPDLVLHLEDSHVVACEHKIDAGETPGRDDEGIDRGQLDRYLNLSTVDAVAYFRSSWRPPSADVLDHPKYVRPAREHFLWSDLYPALEQGSSELVKVVRDGFRTLGYTPAVPSLGDLADDDPATENNRRNLAKLWGKTRSLLHERGWKVIPGSICELYLSNNASSLAEDIQISPLVARGQILRIRVNPRENAGRCADLLRSIVQMSLPYSEVLPLQVTRVSGRCDVVDVTAPIRDVVKTASTTSELEDALWDHLEPVLSALGR